MSTDRFDFEQQIMDCWGVCEDINTLYKLSDIRTMSDDELSNALLGLQTLYQMKFELLFDTFEQMVKDGRIT
jgi:hypothetical protein